MFRSIILAQIIWRYSGAAMEPKGPFAGLWRSTGSGSSAGCAEVWGIMLGSVGIESSRRLERERERLGPQERQRERASPVGKEVRKGL